MSDSVYPVSLANDGEALVIAWSDGVTHRLRWRELRDACPCAPCRVKQEQPQPANLLPVLSAAELQPIRPTSMQPLGNYAYAIHFSDGHQSGIYSFDYLRQLGERTSAP